MEAIIARGIQILIALGGAYFLTLWFAIVVWTFQDIQARSRSVVAQIFSTLVVMIFSIPGLIIYMVLRPRYTLDDAFQRSLEEEYLMQDLEELPLCPTCQQYVEDEWVFCPNCRTELRDNCIACDRLIDLRWEICPFCGTEQYEDVEVAPLAQPGYPIITPSPQYLGQPQLSRTQLHQINNGDAQTRPIIPATVRVDLQSGNVLTESVPEFPVSPDWRPYDRLDAPRRVSLDGNGTRTVEGDGAMISENLAGASDEEQPRDQDPGGKNDSEPVAHAAITEHGGVAPVNRNEPVDADQSAPAPDASNSGSTQKSRRRKRSGKQKSTSKRSTSE